MHLRFSPILVTLFAAARLCEAASWHDDFSDGVLTDGSPAVWTFNEIGASPGTYDASSGDLRLSAVGDPMPLLPTSPDDNNLVPSVDVVFTDTYARTQVLALPDDPQTEARANVGIVLRWNPLTASGYVALADHGSQLEVLRIDGGAPTLLAIQNDVGINALTDVKMEFNVVGDTFEVFLWDPADPKPTAPASVVSDSTYSSGRAGLFFNEDSDGHIGVFRFAAAQDTPFLDPLIGDFNDDGTVDAADYTVWRDGVGSGAFETADYARWSSNYGQTSTITSSASAAPSPGTLSLSGVAVLLARRRTRRTSRLRRRAAGVLRVNAAWSWSRQD